MEIDNRKSGVTTYLHPAFGCKHLVVDNSEINN